MHDEILESGYQIIGVSPQSTGSHARFVERYGLPFRLISDIRKTLIRAFGVDGPMGFGVRRATFLIDTDGTISKRHVSDFAVNSHLEFVRETL